MFRVVAVACLSAIICLPAFSQEPTPPVIPFEGAQQKLFIQMLAWRGATVCNSRSYAFSASDVLQIQTVTQHTADGLSPDVKNETWAKVVAEQKFEKTISKIDCEKWREQVVDVVGIDLDSGAPTISPF